MVGMVVVEGVVGQGDSYNVKPLTEQSTYSYRTRQEPTWSYASTIL